MRWFCIQQWRLIALLVLSATWIVAFPVWRQWVTSSPLNPTQISLSPPRAVEETIGVDLPESYSLHLMFERNGVAFEQLKSSIGAMGVCKIGEQCSKGIPVPVRWSLKNTKTGSIAASGVAESQDSTGWSAAHVYRRLGTVKVPPGRYFFSAEVLRPIPELAYLKTYIAIQLQSKRTTTWQMGLVWWGAVGQYLLAWPAAAYSLVLLLWRAGLTMRSRAAPAGGRPSR